MPHSTENPDCDHSSCRGAFSEIDGKLCTFIYLDCSCCIKFRVKFNEPLTPEFTTVARELIISSYQRNISHCIRCFPWAFVELLNNEHNIKGEIVPPVIVNEI